MTNLIIGLLVGFACCIALMVMWRMATALKDQIKLDESERRENRDRTGPGSSGAK